MDWATRCRFPPNTERESASFTDALLPFDIAAGEDSSDDAMDTDADALDEDDPEEVRDLQLAIVGRPNVGKSTLVNRLIGEDRMLTGPEAGITRDAIGIGWTFQGRRIRLIDTAGLRRKARITQRLEGLAAADTLRRGPVTPMSSSCWSTRRPRWRSRT